VGLVDQIELAGVDRALDEPSYDRRPVRRSAVRDVVPGWRGHGATTSVV
jgi:hypothetical protein